MPCHNKGILTDSHLFFQIFLDAGKTALKKIDVATAHTPCSLVGQMNDKAVITCEIQAEAGVCSRESQPGTWHPGTPVHHHLCLSSSDHRLKSLRYLGY